MDQETLIERVKKSIGWFLFMDAKTSKINDFSSLLKETESLLAGGFVLDAVNITRLHDIDMDIYVNLSNAKKLFEVLTTEYNFRVALLHTAPAYDQSFFRKNNILERIALFRPERRKRITIDIMIIPDTVNVKSVVQNFDLTFCEIWYDGLNVAGTNLENSLARKGYLRDEYKESLLVYFNKFILNRIRKYTKRGYSIDYNCNIGHTKIKETKRQVITGEDWLISKIYNAIMVTQNSSSRYVSNNSDLWKTYTLWSIAHPLIEKSFTELQTIANDTWDDVSYLEKMWRFYNLPYANELSPIKKFFLISLFLDPSFSYSYNYPYNYYIDSWFGISYEDFADGLATWIVEVAMPLKTNLPDLVALGRMEKPPLGDVFEYFMSKITDVDLKMYDKIDKKDLTKKCKPIFDIIDEDEDEDENEDIIRLKAINGDIQNAMRRGDRQKIRELAEEKNILTTKTQRILEEKREKAEMKKYRDINIYNENPEIFLLVLDKDTIICYNTLHLRSALLNKNQWLLECEGDCLFRHKFEVYSEPSLEDSTRIDDLSSVKEVVKVDNKWILKKFAYVGDNTNYQVYLKPEPPNGITILHEKNYDLDQFISKIGPGTTKEECRGDKSMNPVNKRDLYVGTPTTEAVKLYFKASILKGLLKALKDGWKFFFVEPVKGISHTVTYQNAISNYPDYMGAAHCQFGSIISTYTLKIIDNNSGLTEPDSLINNDLPDMYDIL
jgi:hypothetical protein